MPKNQITGGLFQDFEGNPLTNGYLTLQLSHDEQEPDPGQVVGGLPLVVPLDTNGNVSGTVLVWPNDILVPAGSFYFVNAFRHDGTSAWLSPQQLAITSSPSPFNLSNWIPTLPPLTTPLAPAGITLQTNGVNNSNQELLNVAAGTNMTIANVNGTTTFNATGGGGVTTAGSWFIGPGITDISALWAGVRSQAITNFGSNVIIAYLFSLSSSWPLTSCSFQVLSTGGGGSTLNFGIYNAAGSSKLIDANFNGNISTNQTVTFATTTLPAGSYLFASSATTGSILGLGFQAVNSVVNLLTLLNIGTGRIVQAANATSGGVMPATLGALTPITSAASWQGAPYALFSV